MDLPPSNLTSQMMLKALARLDTLLAERKAQAGSSRDVVLIVGGGGAMILAHGFSLSTSDVDAVSKGIEMSELDPLVKQVAREQGLVPDWLNPYFYTFAHTLPSDYEARLIEVFAGSCLKALALGREDMLIMKCFAHRQKDVGHAKALLKKGADRRFVEAHIESLGTKGIPGAQDALDFLDDVVDQL